MAKFHVNPDTGEVGPCRATQKCRFGLSEGQHGSTAEEARQHYEESMSENLLPNSPLGATDVASSKILKSFDQDQATVDYINGIKDLEYDQARPIFEIGYSDVLAGLDEGPRADLYDAAFRLGGGYEAEDGEEPWREIHNEYKEYMGIARLARTGEPSGEISYKTKAAKDVKENGGSMGHVFAAFRRSPNMALDDAKEIMEASYDQRVQELSPEARRAIFDHAAARFSESGLDAMYEDYKDTMLAIGDIDLGAEDRAVAKDALKYRSGQEAKIAAIREMSDRELVDNTADEDSFEGHWVAQEKFERGLR